MILEILAVAIPSAAIGAGIMKLLLMNKKIEEKIDRSERKKYKAMNDPELLLEKLNSNGMMVDDGDEIKFVIEEKDGKKQVVQKTIKNAVAPGVPKVKKPTPKPKNGGKKNVQAKQKK